MAISCIILAAGQSKRFGGIKQLAKIHERELINVTLANYLIPEIEEVFLVLGANAVQIAAVLPAEVKTCVAADWQLGMGHSLSFGVSQLSDDVSHVLVGLADQPFVSAAAIRSLLRCSEHNQDKIVASVFKGGMGPPIIFPSKFFSQLMALKGDKGAKLLLQQNIEQVVYVDIPDAQWDIDTQQDLDQLPLWNLAGENNDQLYPK